LEDVGVVVSIWACDEKSLSEVHRAAVRSVRT